MPTKEFHIREPAAKARVSTTAAQGIQAKKELKEAFEFVKSLLRL